MVAGNDVIESSAGYVVTLQESFSQVNNRIREAYRNNKKLLNNIFGARLIKHSEEINHFNNAFIDVRHQFVDKCA